MPNNVEKLLQGIESANSAMKSDHARLREAFEKIDGRINAMGAGSRIEPFAAGKGGAVIGFRRYHTGWHITTVITGIGGIESEIPATEASPSLQIELVPHVATVLDKLHEAISSEGKKAASARKEADKLVDAVKAT